MRIISSHNVKQRRHSKARLSVVCWLSLSLLSAFFGGLSVLVVTQPWMAHHNAKDSCPICRYTNTSQPPAHASTVSGFNINACNHSLSPTSRPRLDFSPGAAALIMTHTPNNPSSFVALLQNYDSNLPTSWPIIVVTTEKVGYFLQKIPGVSRLLATDGVRLVRIPSSHADLDRRKLLLSTWLWEEALAPYTKILIFDTATALCGNHGGRGVEDFLIYDWVGAAWKWAKPGSPHSFGGNGALSLRTRSLMLQVVRDAISSSQKNQKGPLPPQQPPSPGLREKISRGVESRYVTTFKGNEDMWFVKELFMRSGVRTNSNSSRDNTSGVTVQLAPHQVSMAWAVEEEFDEKFAPLGVYHLMRSMTNALRAKVIRYCPEAKRLFDAKHEREGK